MNNKTALWLLATFLLTTVSVIEAQQSGKVPRIGYLSPGTGLGSPNMKAFELGLKELNYITGQSIAIDYRSGREILIGSSPSPRNWLGSRLILSLPPRPRQQSQPRKRLA